MKCSWVKGLAWVSSPFPFHSCERCISEILYVIQQQYGLKLYRECVLRIHIMQIANDFGFHLETLNTNDDVVPFQTGSFTKSSRCIANLRLTCKVAQKMFVSFTLWNRWRNLKFVKLYPFLSYLATVKKLTTSWKIFRNSVFKLGNGESSELVEELIHPFQSKKTKMNFKKKFLDLSMSPTQISLTFYSRHFNLLTIEKLPSNMVVNENSQNYISSACPKRQKQVSVLSAHISIKKSSF